VTQTQTQIREATAGDLDLVAALDADLFGADGWSPAVMAAEFAAAGETRTLVVAASGSDLFGYAILLTVAEVADVQRIGVARAAQRRGLGSLLMQELMTHATASGCERMLLEVDAYNGSAIAFYQRLGFVEIARRPGYYHTGTDAVVMSRDLPGRTGG
jgi:[ribosomal protein S18]-alanine N-acetyltransferase